MRHVLAYAPILPATAGVIVGIVACEVLPWWVALVAGCASIALFMLRYRWMAFGLVFFAAGMLLCAIMQPNMPPPGVYNHKVLSSAQVLSSNEGENSITLVVRVDSVQHQVVPPFKAQIIVNSMKDTFDPYERCEFYAAYIPPGAPVLPGDADLTSYYKSEGIVAMSYCSDDQITITADAPFLSRMVNSARHRVEMAILNSPVSDDCKVFLLAVIVGDDEFISPSDTEAFRRAGVSHILVLSGLHVGIVVMIVMMLMIPFNLTRYGFYAAPIVAIILVWGYAMLVGMPSSVVRAAIMTTVYMLTRLIQRGHTGFNSLLISMLVILAVRPMWLYSAGFQLSVASVAAILAFTSLLPRQWQRHPVRFYLLMSIIIPVSAMLGTGIIMAIHFSSVSLLFLPANLVAGVLIPWIIGPGVVIMIFSLLGWHLTAMGWVVSKLYSLFLLIVTLVARIPGAELQGVEITPWAVLPYVAAVVFLWLAIYRKSWIWGVSSISAVGITLLIICNFCTSWPKSEFYILPDKDATRIVLVAAGRPMLILPDATPDTVEYLNKANRMHAGYLKLRADCDEFKLLHTPSQLKIANRVIRFVNNSRDTVALHERPNFLLISKGYKGDVMAIYRNLAPDTILISPALHPKISEKIIKSCGDSIPVINLRAMRFKILEDK